MIPSFTNRVFLVTFQFLPVVWKIVLKMSQNGWVTTSWRWMMIKLSLWPLAPGPDYVRSSLTLPQCPSLVVIYHSLSLLKNLGVYLDETLSMDAHIKYLLRILFCELPRIGKIRSFLSTDAASKLAVSLILSKLDYCNSLLAGIPDNKLNKLQRIQNYAARLVLRTSRHARATAMLRTLQWLPVKASIQYKISSILSL